MKKVLSILSFLVLLCALHAESYRICDVSYDISGLTREYALSQKVPVDKDTVFTDELSFTRYIDDLRQQLHNQRVFQSTSVETEYFESDEYGIIPVKLIITTKDTLNIIGVPYPSYNSNTGITLKLKLKDYNFFGSMETMDFDLNYQAQGTDALEDVTHIYGINFGFSVPFQLVTLPSSWTSDFSFSYTVGNPQIDMSICEGIGISIPLFKLLSADVSLKQYYVQDSDYISAHDDKYFQEVISLSLPLTLYSVPSWSNIIWSPSISFSYRWDTDCFSDQPNGGIQSSDLKGPVLSVSNTFSGQRINWLDNFRDGLSASFTQSYRYNLFDASSSLNLYFTALYFKKFCSFAGFTTRGYWFKNFNDSASYIGPMIRGIRDRDWSSTDYLLFNFDFPLSCFHTNWGNLFGWDKLNFFNFEFQLSPFFDFAIGDNHYSNTMYSFKDGFYGMGFECIVYPDRFRSIQGRISFGLDAVQFLMKQDAEAGRTNGISQKLFNTGWRSSSSSWYELSIGIGLFY